MFKFFVFTLVQLFMLSAFGQTATDKQFEFSLEGASFLPSRIPWVQEILIGIDPRITIPTSKGKFEIDAFLANGSGTSYSSFSLDYRYDLGVADLPAFILAGVNVDFWSAPAPNDSPAYGRGFHFGGGFMQALTSGFSVREDIKYRLGPGTTLIVGLGLNYQFSN